MQTIDQKSNVGNGRDTRAGSRSLKDVAELANCIPNRMIAAVMIAGMTGELILLSQVDYPLIKMGASVAFVTVAFIGWFWLTIGLGLHRASRWLVRIRETFSGFRRVTLTAMLLGALVTGTMLYVISWGLFLQTSRFASWEVLRFTFNNSDDLWLYFQEAEPIHLIHGSILICAIGVFAYFLARPASKVRHEQADRPLFFNKLWVLSLSVFLVGMSWVNFDVNSHRRLKNFAAISNTMNPAITLCSSAVYAFAAEPIRPVLDDVDLVPLDTPWSPKPLSASGTPSPPEKTNVTYVANADSSLTPNITPDNTQNNNAQRETSLPSIIMVQIESLRSDVIHQSHQGREITPNINGLALKGMEWTNAYSQATHSDYADPCVVSSLYPLRSRAHHYYSLNDPWPKHLSYDCLKPAGYATATISSQNEMWGRMEWFLDTPNLDLFYHPERAQDKHLANDVSAQDIGFYREVQCGNLTVGKFPDHHTADVAINWIQRQKKTGKPFLLNMNLQSSHFPYMMSDDIPRPFQPCKLSSDIKFMQYHVRDVDTVRNAYFNSLHETDRQVGRIVEELRQLDLLDNVILVVVGENGEGFHENRVVCHAGMPYEPAIHVATVMYGPKWFKAATEDYPLEHVDLLPTIFRSIGLEPHPNFQGIDALSAERPALEKRCLFCHVNSPTSNADTVQWAGRWKYLWDHLSQNGELYDLKNDTGEAHNRAAELPELARALHTHLFNWRNRQLAWYHYPTYYRNYYPPKAPTMSDSDLASIQKYLQN